MSKFMTSVLSVILCVTQGVAQEQPSVPSQPREAAAVQSSAASPVQSPRDINPAPEAKSATPVAKGKSGKGRKILWIGLGTAAAAAVVVAVAVADGPVKFE